ncbi:hypothetical protein L7F22_050845, partial [Adiantum nelumboides]|nr:hypothetical protein [Adiantum nelumboides]
WIAVEEFSISITICLVVVSLFVEILEPIYVLTVLFVVIFGFLATIPKYVALFDALF